MTTLIPCGHRGAHARHRNHCETPCGPCARAARDYHRQRYLWRQARAFASRARGGAPIESLDVA